MKIIVFFICFSAMLNAMETKIDFAGTKDAAQEELGMFTPYKSSEALAKTMLYLHKKVLNNGLGKEIEQEIYNRIKDLRHSGYIYDQYYIAELERLHTIIEQNKDEKYIYRSIVENEFLLKNINKIISQAIEDYDKRKNESIESLEQQSAKKEKQKRAAIGVAAANMVFTIITALVVHFTSC